MAMNCTCLSLRFERAGWFDGDKSEDQGIRSTKKKNNEKSDVAPFRRGVKMIMLHVHETSGVPGVR